MTALKALILMWKIKDDVVVEQYAANRADKLRQISYLKTLFPIQGGVIKDDVVAEQYAANRADKLRQISYLKTLSPIQGGVVRATGLQMPFALLV
ncbi:unnamed protein product [Strongylus vulgaris]|uniref:Uncharacterized protein n=1 Tax=Strongylus vulgaris TaxID=40348 RepID=A0A3P7J7I0_STRVU|nr:unnamed protein product [Strongylus vulgaris]